MRLILDIYYPDAGDKPDKEPERVKAPATDAVRRIASKFRLPKKR